MTLDRRQFGKLSLGALLLGPLVSMPGLSLAANPTRKPLPGLSAFGELNFAPDSQALSYVNSNAPKGGTFNFAINNWGYNQNPQTFDTLNSFVLKGAAPPRIENCFVALMTRAWDEASAVYGYLAETVTISEDRNSYTFKLRKEARWHDGTPVTAQDVAFTYTTFKKDGHPDITVVLTHLDKAEALDDETVVLTFNGKQSDQTILTVSILPIISKAFYSENDFTKTTLTPPLGAGPYKVGRVNPGTFIEYDRVKDWWAKDLSIFQGVHNFDVLRVEFFRESIAGFEAFKKGEIHYRQEFTSKRWATEYDFPAVAEKRVVQRLFPSDKRPSMQGTVCNMRRAKLADPRTREALGYCFDFEWTNTNLFYGAYARNQSYFQNSDYMATGKPSPEELALLEPLRDKLPAAVFDEAHQQPVSNGSGRDRAMLRRANDLFAQAGWKRKGRQLVDNNGQPFTLEFLLRSPSFERILGKYVENLRTVGVDATIRLVDPAQYQRRLETFDFDVTVRALGYAAVPTVDFMDNTFGSKAASVPGSGNVSGLSDPAVDALIAKIGSVNSQAELTVVMRALDRVLRLTHSWIPNWHSANHRTAYWDMFGIPERKPDYWFPVEATWWYDEEKAKAIGKA